MTWVTLLLTTVGAGATGALITTYGAQSRDRRQARAHVRTALATAERVCQAIDASPDSVNKAIAEVENSAFLAAVPSRVVEIYRDARLADYLALRSRNEKAVTTPNEDITNVAAVGAATLLLRVLWHPILTTPGRYLRARKIRRVLYCGITFEHFTELLNLYQIYVRGPAFLQHNAENEILRDFKSPDNYALRESFGYGDLFTMRKQFTRAKRLSRKQRTHD